MCIRDRLDGDAQRVIACQPTGGLIVIDEVEDRAGVGAAGIGTQGIKGFLDKISIHISLSLIHISALEPGTALSEVTTPLMGAVTPSLPRARSIIIVRGKLILIV